MKYIKYNKQGTGKYESVIVQVTTEFGQLSLEQQKGFEGKILTICKEQEICGEVLFYWMKKQECSLHGKDLIIQPYSFDLTPGYPANFFARLPSYFMECDDESIICYIAPRSVRASAS